MNESKENTSSCYFFFSLLFFFFDFSPDPLSCWLSPPFILLPSSFPAMYLLIGFVETLVLSDTFFYHFLIIKADFWSVSIVQISHSTFNEVDIRYEKKKIMRR